MTELKPPYKKLAQSNAILIRAGTRTIDDVPTKPATLKPRVIEILEE